jgi:hypothetical protein
VKGQGQGGKKAENGEKDAPEERKGEGRSDGDVPVELVTICSHVGGNTGGMTLEGKQMAKKRGKNGEGKSVWTRSARRSLRAQQ